jgi:pimeloyl-ACP methyl ester carboxylesterase
MKPRPCPESSPLRTLALGLTVALGGFSSGGAWADGRVSPAGIQALAASGPNAAAATPATVVPVPCRVPGLKREVLCGQLKRPLDPAQPGGPAIGIHYVVVPATALNKRPDPVFFLAGGPGQSAIDLAGTVQPLFARLNNRRDIVYVDQRGTGRSAPLDCGSEEALPLARRLDVEDGLARVAECRRRLQALPHGDLRHYTTAIAMADLDAVRAALGAPQLNLVGGSYGTRAALEFLRQFPGQVRRAVIDGVAPPDMVLPASMATDSQAALEALWRDCAAEPACQARHPRLAERWAELLASLPRRVSVIDPATGAPVELLLTREMAASALRGPLYAPAFAAALPHAIGEAVEGRFTPLIGLAGAMDGGGRRGRLAMGMHFSVVCAEDMPRLDAAPRAGEFGEAMAASYRRVCADWPRGAVPPAFYSVPPSPVPVLAFSGGLDPATPPRHGARVVAALGPKARHVVVPQAGHGVMGLGCAADLLHRFIVAEDEATALAVDAACLARVPRPGAFEPPRPGAAP